MNVSKPTYEELENQVQELKAQLAIQSSKKGKKYQSFFENINVGIALHKIIVDDNNIPIDFIFQEANKTFEKIVQLKLQDIKGKRGKKQVQKLEKKWIDTYQKVIQNYGEKISLELSDSSSKHWMVNAYPIKKNQFVIEITDITKSKQAEESLKINEEWLRSVFRVAPAGIGVVKNRVFTELNNRFSDITGYSKNELLGKSSLMIYPSQEEFERVGKVKYNQIAENEIGTVETIFQKKDGSNINIILSSVPIDIDDLSKGVTFTALDITERKKAEEALRASEKIYRSTINALSSYIHVVDRDMKLTLCNDALLKRTADFYSGSVIGEYLFNVFTFLPENVKKEYKKVLKTGEISLDEESLVIEGELRWSETARIPVFDDANNVSMIVTIIRDITDKKQAEIEIEKNKERLSLALFGSNSGIWDWNIKTNKVYFDSNYYTMAGYEPNEFPHSYEEWQKRVHKDDINETERTIAEYLKGNSRDYTVEFRFLRKDGEWMWILGRGKILERDKKGKPVRFSGTHVDITTRHEAEKLVIENERKLETLMSNLQGMVYRCRNDEDWPMEFVSQGSKEITGYMPDELIEGKVINYGDLICEEDRQYVWDAIQKANLNKEQFILEYRIKTKDGSIKWVWEKGIIIPNFDQGENVLEGFIMDISQRKEAENKLKNKNEEYLAINEELQESLERINNLNEELKLAKEKAEESDRLKSSFLANMSHEIRTPMNGIIGFSEMFSNPDLSDDKRKFYSNIIINSSKQLLNIVNDILDISLIESGGIKIQNTEFQVNELIEDIYNFYKPQAEDKKISLEKYLESHSENIIIKTDKLRVRQIIINLVNNAFKFTKKGFVKFGYKPLDSELLFIVEDSGVGIAENNIEKIFERFRQEEVTMSKQFGGTGLGLSISQKLVEILGGKIWVESEKGKGSVFYFTIPYNKVISSKTSILEKTEAHIEKKLKILLVEDEEINKIFVEEILLKDNVEIIHANNGKESVNLCKKKTDIDIVLMDLKMPVMNGYDATKELKKINPNLPIIAQTAYAMPDDEKKALDVGCDAYISKPINAENLVNLINLLVNK